MDTIDYLKEEIHQLKLLLKEAKKNELPTIADIQADIHEASMELQLEQFRRQEEE